ncbi:hypothetical protein [Streptomyces sp. AP-93]|uniref:hypothetical protein n=1 Tax=Streptomyces sp. AP-93 TaxID=2929048 RepID=UPI001FB012B5|nr:hypothetical protein [Streptomyces sp. AP-93]MCJ0871197.1 hypothetical protein [Streptomyces sp. AP-93]
MAGIVLSVTLAAGCSGSGGGAGGADAANGKGRTGAFGEQLEAAGPTVKLSVPPQYDGSKGWDETLGWVPESVGSLPVASVPRTGSVALLYGSPEGYTVKTRAADGRAGWSSAPWKVPIPVNADEGGTSSDEVAEIPDLTDVEVDGRGYVVAYAHGMSGKDALHEGTEVVRLAVFPADSSGVGVKPLREVDVPVSGSAQQVRVSADGGRLLVAYGERGPYPRSGVAVDVTTGSVTPYEDPNKLLPQCTQATLCQTSRVMAVSPDGPLVSMGLGYGFGVPGRWFSDSVRPDGVPSKAPVLERWNGRAYGVTNGRLLASWANGGKDGEPDRPPTWSVHDVRTGALPARMECAYKETPGILDQSPAHATIASPSGRYLAAGPVTFDVERKKGICLEGDGNRKTISLASIRDDGTAYGVVDNGEATASEAVVAQIDLNSASGDAKVLGAGVDIPLLTDVAGGGGLFLARDDNKNLRVSLRRGH